MRYLFFFWFLPLGLFWGWFGLSYYDINFGSIYFSRLFHDFVFQIYADTIGLERQVIVDLLIKACIVDTAILFSIIAFRRRKQIRDWWTGNPIPKVVAPPVSATTSDGQAHPAV